LTLRVLIDDTGRLPGALMHVRRSAIVVSLLALAGCLGHGRTFSTPLTAAEGQLMVPALVSTAESMGLEAWGHEDVVQVRLEDGTQLQWWEQQGRFVLTVSPVAEGDVAMRDAKVRADQIWEQAVQARQANNIGAAVTVQPRPPPNAAGYSPPPPVSGGYSPPPSSSPARAVQPDGFACVSGADCQSGMCTSGRCGHGGGGAFGNSGSTPGGGKCSFSSDCASGNCRFGVCQGGGAGAPCSFSSDCPSGRCTFGKCQ
jgi:hypothetical protein